MRMLPSVVCEGHPDFLDLGRIRNGIVAAGGGLEKLHAGFPQTIRDAIDFVLDPVRTGRTILSELDNVEKTFVGLKVEHFVRDILNAPKGLRDLVIDGRDVDIKNTLDRTWMIPPETYRNEDPCLVINSKEQAHTCWMGLMMAREEYLNAPNRDGKRSVKSSAIAHVLWIVEGVEYPDSLWRPFDMEDFRELRVTLNGTRRAAEFFRRNLEVPVHRSIIQALLYDQYDYMKRVRGNQGARDVLRQEGIALLSGVYHNQLLQELGRLPIDTEAMIAVKPRSPEERNHLLNLDIIDR